MVNACLQRELADTHAGGCKQDPCARLALAAHLFLQMAHIREEQQNAAHHCQILKQDLRNRMLEEEEEEKPSIAGGPSPRQSPS